ncbi:unnamed protein product [Cyprideis torosa]|uniref:Uncharacterized protein n=1 Tax=Cyprideis torosa TaxID=163714 RepID=A0A7R8W1J9_9CRUS|nr:unnamed protein product [Cyprideis torosa]CAG0880827.1 unnamed protein product [Cyprideis torosa]
MVMDRSRSTSSGRSGSSAKKASSSGSSSSGRAPAFPSLFDASNMFAAAHWLQDPLMGPLSPLPFPRRQRSHSLRTHSHVPPEIGQLASMSGSSQSQAQAASLAAAGLNPLAAAGYPPSLFSSSSTPSTTTTATSSNSKENSAAVMAAAANQWYAMAASQLAAQEYYARLGLAPDPLLAASLDHMISAQNALLKQQQKSSSSNSSSNRQRIPSSSPTKTSKASPSPSATLTSAQHAALIAAGLGASMLGAPPQKTPATSSPSPRTTSSMSSVTSVSDSLRNLEELAGVKRSASSSVMGSTATSKADNAFPKATGSTPSSLIDFTTPSVSKRPRTSTTTSSSSTDPKKKGGYSDVLLGKNIPGLTISVIGNGQSGNAVSLEPTDLSVKKAATNGPVSPASDGPLDLCMKPGKEKDRGRVRGLVFAFPSGRPPPPSPPPRPLGAHTTPCPTNSWPSSPPGPLGD